MRYQETAWTDEVYIRILLIYQTIQRLKKEGRTNVTKECESGQWMYGRIFVLRLKLHSHYYI